MSVRKGSIMGIQRLARKNRKLQRMAIGEFHKNMPASVREAVIVEMGRQAKMRAAKKAATYCGLGMVFIVACVLAFGGCGDGLGNSVGMDGTGCDVVRADASALGDSLQLERSDARLANSDSRSVGSDANGDGDVSSLDDGAAGQTSETRNSGVGACDPATDLNGKQVYPISTCPAGHFRCPFYRDGTPVTECLYDHNLCVCCDAPMPGIDCNAALMTVRP